MDRSKIEWTDASWTPIRAARTGPAGDFKIGWHCEHVSEGCTNCYAESINRRLGTGRDFKPGHLAREGRAGDVSVFLDEKMLTQPLRWRRPRTIFVCSMTDLFGSWVTDGQIMRVFNVMAQSPQHTFQVLTKRPERARDFLTRLYDLTGEDPMEFRGARGPEATRAAHPSGRGQLFADMLEAMGDPPPGAAYPTFDWMNGMANWHMPSVLRHVWLGTSVEDQATADERIPHLLAAPAAVRFLSAEPLLGPLDLHDYLVRAQNGFAPGPDWLIVGGESGPGARPMHEAWARSLRDQCASAGVAFFMKQMAKKAPIPADLMVREMPGA